MRRIVAWKAWEGFGSELLELSEDDRGVRAVGTLIRQWPAGPMCVDYEVRCDRSWRFISAEVALRGIEKRSLRIDDLGRCSDLDISACAFTNTLPIRRLSLAAGESATLSVAFVSIADLRVETVRQRYTRLATLQYRYEGLDSGFTAEITVDEDGLVVEYPQLCRRIWPVLS